MAHSIHVVSGLGVMVRYLTEQLSAFSNPILQCKLDIAIKKINDLNNVIQSKEQCQQDFARQVKDKESDFLEELENLKRELEAEKNRHSKEKDQLLDMHEREIKVLQDKHAFQIKSQDDNYRKILLQIDEKDKVIENRQNDIHRLEERILDLESCMKQEKDKRVKALQDKLKSSVCEVESLNAVLELKDDKIRSLNHRVMEMEEEVKDFPGLRQNMRLLQQKVEQLEVSLANKNDQLTRLLNENANLQTQAETSIREKKRLSLRNEELEFALTESFMSSSVANSSVSHVNTFSTPAVVKNKRVSSAILLTHKNEDVIENPSQTAIESSEAGVVIRKSRSSSISSSHHDDPEETPIKPFNFFYHLNAEGADGQDSVTGLSTSTPSATSTVYSFDSSGKKICNFFPRKTHPKALCHRKVPVTPPQEDLETSDCISTPKAEPSTTGNHNGKGDVTENNVEKSDAESSCKEDESNLSGIIRTGTWSRKRRAKSKTKVESNDTPVDVLLVGSVDHNTSSIPVVKDASQRSFQSKASLPRSGTSGRYVLQSADSCKDSCQDSAVIVSSQDNRSREDTPNTTSTKSCYSSSSDPGKRNYFDDASNISPSSKDCVSSHTESEQQQQRLANNQTLVNSSKTRLMTNAQNEETCGQHTNESSGAASAPVDVIDGQEDKEDSPVMRQHHDVHVRII